MSLEERQLQCGLRSDPLLRVVDDHPLHQTQQLLIALRVQLPHPHPHALSLRLHQIYLSRIQHHALYILLGGRAEGTDNLDEHGVAIGPLE